MDEKVWDKCPKCSSKLTNKVECGTCGIIFEKYFQAETRKKLQAEKEAETKSASKKRPFLILVGLVLVGAVGACYYFLGRTSNPPTSNMIAKTATVNEDQKTESPVAQSPPIIQSTPVAEPESSSKGGGGQNDKWFIQNASAATVTIVAPWGSLGSGFFISENSIITNKHVVEFNSKQFEE